MINKHLGIKLTSPVKTSGPADDKTPSVTDKPKVAMSSTAESKKFPGRYQGFGTKQSYASFCVDYYYSLAFPETLKPRINLFMSKPSSTSIYSIADFG
jgi:hypothetical protein